MDVITFLLNSNSDEIIGKIMANHTIPVGILAVIVAYILKKILPKELYERLIDVWKKRKAG